MPKIELRPLPPAEAVRFFRSKGFRISFAWQDVWQEEHGKSFTVAKAMRMDILQDIRSAVDSAIADGTTFADFQKRLTPVLQEKGWWGKQIVEDPRTGDKKLVQLGSPRRLKTIFDVNMRTSYAVGRWQRVERLKEARPFLRYVAVQDNRTRPEHTAWHGTVLPIDDPWWDTHYPPNGWRCRCTVVQLSQRDLDRHGFEPSPSAPPSPTRRVFDKRLKKTLEVPEGIDPGWAHHVGKAGTPSSLDVLADKIARADPDIARASVADLVRASAFRDFVSGDTPGNHPVGVLPPKLMAAIGARTQAVLLSRGTAQKQLRRHPEIEAEDYARIQRILDEGEAFQDRKRHVVVLLEDGVWYQAVVKATEDGRETFLNSYHRTRPNAVERKRERGKRLR